MLKLDWSLFCGVVAGGGIIALAFYQRHVGPLPVPQLAWYIAAVVIVLAPVVVAILRGRACCR